MNVFKLLAIGSAAVALSAPALAENCANTTFSALAASACAGSFVGNLNGSAAELTVLGSSFPGSFSYAGSSNDASFGPFTADPSGATGGTLTFDSAISGQFVIGLKAANNYSFYLFNAASPLTSLSFDSTAGVALNAQGLPQNLSHATLYVGAVPEPETYALMLAGLGVIGWVGRRRRA